MTNYNKMSKLNPTLVNKIAAQAAVLTGKAEFYIPWCAPVNLTLFDIVDDNIRSRERVTNGYYRTCDLNCLNVLDDNNFVMPTHEMYVTRVTYINRVVQYGVHISDSRYLWSNVVEVDGVGYIVTAKVNPTAAIDNIPSIMLMGVKEKDTINYKVNGYLYSIHDLQGNLLFVPGNVSEKLKYPITISLQLTARQMKAKRSSAKCRFEEVFKEMNDEFLSNDEDYLDECELDDASDLVDDLRLKRDIQRLLDCLSGGTIVG